MFYFLFEKKVVYNLSMYWFFVVVLFGHRRQWAWAMLDEKLLSEILNEWNSKKVDRLTSFRFGLLSTWKTKRNKAKQRFPYFSLGFFYIWFWNEMFIVYTQWCPSTVFIRCTSYDTNWTRSQTPLQFKQFIAKWESYRRRIEKTLTFREKYKTIRVFGYICLIQFFFYQLFLFPFKQCKTTCFSVCLTIVRWENKNCSKIGSHFVFIKYVFLFALISSWILRTFPSNTPHENSRTTCLNIKYLFIATNVSREVKIFLFIKYQFLYTFSQCTNTHTYLYSVWSMLWCLYNMFLCSIFRMLWICSNKIYWHRMNKNDNSSSNNNNKKNMANVENV